MDKMNKIGQKVLDNKHSKTAVKMGFSKKVISETPLDKAKQHGKTEVLNELEEPMKTSAKIQNIE